jgi:hypothetical protein
MTSVNKAPKPNAAPTPQANQASEAEPRRPRRYSNNQKSTQHFFQCRFAQRRQPIGGDFPQEVAGLNEKGRRQSDQYDRHKSAPSSQKGEPAANQFAVVF